VDNSKEYFRIQNQKEQKKLLNKLPETVLEQQLNSQDMIHQTCNEK
jgi:hypothetical protein